MLYKLAGWWPLAAPSPENQVRGYFVPAIDTGTFAKHLGAFLARLSWNKFLTGSIVLYHKLLELSSTSIGSRN